MKIVNIVVNLSEWLKLLRENQIKLEYMDFVEMYRDFKNLRALRGSKYESTLNEVAKKYGLGKTKAWDIIKAMDKDV